MYETLVRYLQFLPSDVLPNCHLIAPESVLVVVGEAVTRIGVSIQGVPYYWAHFVFVIFSGSRAHTEELFIAIG